ncbi:MAG TPA: protein kinase [Gemmatimonadaceae bacterium]|nr:protein kinase [Gemmatimonadaceae bacterium]
MDAVAQLNAALTGRYEVEREIGAGGMATVYLARDVRHDRRVALKVLRPELGAVLGVERFLAEIKVTANLQHPNLLPLFDSGEAEGLLFYVMPYVEGESLRARLDREKQLPVDEAIRIAVAVASALDYAHRHQVIHRDLKPENILMQAGQPVLADFGIALAVAKAGGARITQTGLSLGTPQYMSPEQATGDRAIDGRTDIYSLGAVLYEMLVGDPPYLGGTSQAIIAKVLTDRPRAVRASRPSVPAHVEATIDRALEKLPADRFATAREFAEALEGKLALASPSVATTGAGRDGGAAAPARGLARVRRVAPWAIAAAAVAVAAIVTLRPLPRARPSTFELLVPDSAGVASAGGVRIGVSRDGSQLAYVGRTANARAIYVRALDDVQPRLVRGTENGLAPVFSPDASWLLFFEGTKLKKVPVVGGSPLVVADTASPQAHWGDGNQVVFTRRNAIWRVSADGGEPALVARPDSSRGQVALGWPRLLPGGKAALITIWKGTISMQGAQLGVVTVPGGKVTELGLPGMNPSYSASGHVLFGRPDGSVFAARFSSWRRKVIGPAVPVLQQVSVRGGGVVEAAVADDGTLVYLSGVSGKRKLVAVDRRGATRPIGDEEQFFGWPRVSPDGRRIAVEIGTAAATWDVWLYEIASGTLARLTNNFTGVRPGGWSADGRKIAYLATDSASPLAAITRANWLPWNASGGPEPLILSKTTMFDIAVGPAHGYLAFRHDDPTTRGDIWLAPLDSPTAARPFIATTANEVAPRISSDGKWLAYASDETGRAEVYVRPIVGPGGRVQVSAGGGVEPVWVPGGRDLFYRGPQRMMVASVTASPDLAVAKRDTLFEDSYFGEGAVHQYDVFPGGKELLMIRSEAGALRPTVVLNWTELLRRRAPGGR